MPAILVLYTGGTIGSFEDHETKSLKPVDFERLKHYIPELNQLEATVDVFPFAAPKDSSDIGPADWVRIVETIELHYTQYDGFVVLHGTDTMAYTASAVSFMIENLSKPIIFTGSQLPIGKIRTDGKENLITAIEIAAAQEHGKPLVPEVCIYFEFKLYRANRTFKFSAEHFNAYMSPNYPPLAEAGVEITYFRERIMTINSAPTKFYKSLNTNIFILKLFPGIQRQVVENVIKSGEIRAIILETFGFGNGPTDPWFIDILQQARSRGIILLNITQCKQGQVLQGYYQTSVALRDLGVIGGSDLTPEAAVAKLMWLLGTYSDTTQVEQLLAQPCRGEMSTV